jgi:PadR family transcriptional regulator PadR
MTFTVSGVLLDACVLGALSAAPAYGYELTQKTQAILGVSESALYPVLRRLLKDEMLVSYDVPYDGRNRRYYRLTDKGASRLAGYSGGWQAFRDNIDEMILGGQKAAGYSEQAVSPIEEDGGKKWYE